MAHPGDLEGRADSQGSAHAQEVHEKTLSTPLVDLEHLYNQKVKAKAESSTTCWSVEVMPQQTQRTSW